LSGSQRGADWVTGISPTAFKGVSDLLTQQVADRAGPEDASAAAVALSQRSIVPDDAPILAGSLPFSIRSAHTYRYDALPSSLQQMISVSLYDSSFAVDGDAPEFTVAMPLARLGTAALQVEYRGAASADAALIQQYATSNSVTLAASSLSVVPQLKLG